MKYKGPSPTFAGWDVELPAVTVKDLVGQELVGVWHDYCWQLGVVVGTNPNRGLLNREVLLDSGPKKKLQVDEPAYKVRRVCEDVEVTPAPLASGCPEVRGRVQLWWVTADRACFADRRTARTYDTRRGVHLGNLSRLRIPESKAPLVGVDGLRRLPESKTDWTWGNQERVWHDEVPETEESPEG